MKLNLREKRGLAGLDCPFVLRDFPNIVISIPVPSVAPEILDTVPVNGSALVIRWKPPPIKYHNGIILGYQVSSLDITGNFYSREYSFRGNTKLKIWKIHSKLCQLGLDCQDSVLICGRNVE